MEAEQELEALEGADMGPGPTLGPTPDVGTVVELLSRHLVAQRFSHCYVKGHTRQLQPRMTLAESIAIVRSRLQRAGVEEQFMENLLEVVRTEWQAMRPDEARVPR